MRIVIKPLGLVVIMVAVVCGLLLPRFFPLKSSGSKTAKAAASTAPDTTNSSEQGNVLVPENWEMYTEKEASATQSTVAVQDQPFKEAYRFDIHTIGAEPWNIGFHNKLSQATFTEGESLQLHFWARSSQNTQVSVVMQQSVPPYTESARNELTLSTTWQEFNYDLKSAAYPAGGAYLSFLLGRAPGTVEIADIRLIKK